MITAKDAGNTHGLVIAVLYHYFGTVQGPFCAIQCGKLCSFRIHTDLYLLSCDFISIKGMEWLPETVEYVVRNVNNIIDRT